jgi:hypothetical protein
MDIANQDIRTKVAESGVRLYQVAHAIGYSEANFSKMLRFELPEDRKALIFEAISAIAEGKPFDKKMRKLPHGKAPAAVVSRLGDPSGVKALLDTYKMLVNDFVCDDGAIGRWVSEKFLAKYIYPEIEMLRLTILNLCGFKCSNDHEIPDALYDMCQFDSREDILKAIKEVV